jgi:DNA invertase Pin-like site-specific DNA recombinase
MKDTLHIYTRVSSSIQETDGTSLESQKDLGIQKSKELGMKHKVWNEGAKSSHGEDITSRVQLVALLSAIENDDVKHLWVYNNDRLSRNEDTQYTIKYALRKNDVLLYTKDGTFDLNNPQDKLFKSLLDGIAQYDNAIRAERSRIGKINKVRKGEWYGAPPPFGFHVVDSFLVPNPDEDKVVKRIFNWFYKGKTIVEIKRFLDKEGSFARRGGLFSTGSINKLLQNTHHIGYYSFTDKKSNETIPCKCPAIVDETIWNFAQQRRIKTSQRRTQNNPTKKFYLLREFLYCGECGNAMNARIHEIRNQRNYFCSAKTSGWKNATLPKDKRWVRGKVGSHGCNMTRSMNIPITDEFVWNTVVDTVANSSTLKIEFKDKILEKKNETDADIEDKLKKLKQKSLDLRNELSTIQSSIAEVETQNILKVYDEVIYNQIKIKLDEKYKSNKEKIEQTRLAIKELGNQKRWIDWVGKYAESVEDTDQFSPEQQQEYLRGIIERIDVYLDKETQDHHLDICFRLPLVGDGIEYVDAKDKTKGYDLVDGDTIGKVVLYKSLVDEKNKNKRLLGRQTQNLKKKVNQQSTYHLTRVEYDC